MDAFIDWLRNYTDVFGFAVAALIFIITIFLVSRRFIGFWITLLFLLFSLLSGLTISNQEFLRKWMMKDCPVKQESKIQEARNTPTPAQAPK